MSQHDMNIANQTASSARADINNALGALTTLQSGTSAPTTTFANQLWLDTNLVGAGQTGNTSGLYTLKRRNGANSGWQDMFYLDPDGSKGMALEQSTEIFNSVGAKVGQMITNSQNVWLTGTNTELRMITAADLKGIMQLATPSYAPFKGSLSVVDQKTAGTGPQSRVAGWNDRNLNTILLNTITGASLSSNIVTLPSGKYTWSASAFAFLVQGHVLQLYNSTDSVSLGQSPNCTMTSGYNGSTAISAEGGFTLSASKSIKLRHWLAAVGDGFGSSLNTGFPNTYATLKIDKVDNI